MKKLVPIVLLFVLNTSSLSAKSVQNQSKLFLVGGGLKTCSSMAPKYCRTQKKNNKTNIENTKAHALFSISNSTINLIEEKWPVEFDSSTKQKIIEVLSNIQKAATIKKISLNKLKDLLKQYDRKDVIHKLNDAEYYLMLDFLEQPVLANNTKTRLKEQVDLNNSTDLFSTEIYTTFVSLAKNISADDSPKILVMTASARDPFEAVDFYKAVFTQAGGKTTWLPLDATLNALFQKTGERQDICQQLSSTRTKIQGSTNREFVYPDLVNQQREACLSPQNILNEIANAEGIFINGGDQSLTLQAFVNIDGTDSQALTLIKQKLANGELIIGGTSAGTAVMSGSIFDKAPVVMITNGQSNTAVVRGAKKDVLPMEGCQKSARCHKDLLNDDLTYRSSGGLGLFHWGILDTHFSERGRQGRLAKLALATDTRFAFGVDEATALVVDKMNSEKIELSVVGRSGVFIIENNQSTDKTEAVLSHYVTRGDKVTLANNTLEFQLADWKTQPSDSVKLPSNITDIFDRNRYQQTAELLCRTNHLEISAISRWNKTNTTIVLKKAVNAVSRYGAISWEHITRGYCSYQNYRLIL